MKLKRIVKSKEDSTKKYIFYTDDNLIIEFSYINKDDGKDIICVPSQTMCNIGCKFCHTTDYIGKIKTRNLTEKEIADGVAYVYSDLELAKTPRTLLISYMGCGEPILNNDGVVGSMQLIKNSYEVYTRFAVATSLPKNHYPEFFEFTKRIGKLPVKLHLSLHYTNDFQRKEWMPRALEIKPSILAAYFFRMQSGNPVEIHYALLEGVNDSEEDAQALAILLKDKDFNVKFLFYNEKDSLVNKPSPRVRLKSFRKALDEIEVEHEYYIPPGLSIGASCGQFLMEEYLT